MAGRRSYDLTVERGIRQRHEDQCRAGEGRRCSCRTRAFIGGATVDGRRRWSPTLRTLDAARRWRAGALAGTLEDQGDNGLSVRDGWRAWLRAAEQGVALTRGGTRYRQTTLDDYDTAMRRHALGLVGDVPLGALDRVRVQRMLDTLAEQGVAASRLHSTATALRALTRWAERRGLGVQLARLELPRVGRRTPTVMGPVEVERLLGLLPAGEVRGVHAVCAFTGARALEVIGLHVEDLGGDVIRLGEREATKTPAGRRTVPVIDVLRPYLAGWGRPGSGPLIVGKPRSSYSRVLRAAGRSWARVEPRPTMHVLRHNWISWMLAAGVPLPAVQVLSGHATPLVPGVTLAVYGHALEDHVATARDVMDRWISTQS